MADEPDGKDEEERERYRELLEELRTINPGVQVLFAFLLTVPFSNRFGELDQVGVRVFTLALLAVGLAAVFFLTPTAYHRISPRDDRRERLRLGIRTTITGMALLALSIGAGVFVVARLIFETESIPIFTTLGAGTVASVAAAVVGGGAVFMWFLLPLLHRRRRH